MEVFGYPLIFHPNFFSKNDSEWLEHETCFSFESVIWLYPCTITTLKIWGMDLLDFLSWCQVCFPSLEVNVKVSFIFSNVQWQCSVLAALCDALGHDGGPGLDCPYVVTQLKPLNQFCTTELGPAHHYRGWSHVKLSQYLSNIQALVKITFMPHCLVSKRFSNKH